MKTHYSKTLPSERVIHRLQASVASIRNRIVFSTSFGEGVAASGSGVGPVMLGWSFHSDANTKYELWIRYASTGSVPAQIAHNGIEIYRDALRDSTFGIKPRSQAWVYQGIIGLVEGENELVISANDALPRISEVALLSDDGSRPLNLNERRSVESEQVSNRILDPIFLQRLVRELAPPLRAALLRYGSIAETNELVTALTSAIAQDIDNPQARVGFHGPLNGQIIRQAIFVELNRLMDFDVFLETGGYLGTTTEMLTTYGCPVYSCESKLEFYLRAAARLASISNVEIIFQDSRIFLESFCTGNKSRYSMPFFYLDAHWNDDLPLPEEINIIQRSFSSFLIMVDDFKHPTFDYAYDKYPTGIELTLEYLIPRLPAAADLSFFFPSLPENLESGARRGTLVIVPRTLSSKILDSGIPLTAYSPESL